MLELGFRNPWVRIRIRVRVHDVGSGAKLGDTHCSRPSKRTFTQLRRLHLPADGPSACSSMVIPSHHVTQFHFLEFARLQNSLLVPTQFLSNGMRAGWRHRIRKPTYALVGANMAVDSFFFLSGFLATLVRVSHLSPFIFYTYLYHFHSISALSCESLI